MVYALILLSIFSLAAHEHDYLALIKEHNLSTMPWHDEACEYQDFCVFLDEVRKMQMDPPPFKMRKQAFEICEHVWQEQKIPISTILNDVQTWDDIALFRGQQHDDPYLAAFLDRTQTECGRVSLYQMLLPTDDIETIQKRQQVVRHLIDNPNRLDQIKAALHEIAQAQAFTLSFWMQDPLAHVTDRYYFRYPILKKLNNTLNHHYGTMWLTSTSAHVHKVANFATLITAIAIPFVYYGWRQYADVPSSVENLNTKLKGFGEPYFNFLVSLAKSPTLDECARWVTIGFSLLSVKPFYVWLKGQFSLMKLLQERIMHVRRFVHAAQDLHHQVGTDDILRQQVWGTQHLNSQDADEDSYVAAFYRLASSGTFQGEPSMFSHHGKILSAFSMVELIKPDLEQMMVAVGQLDAYASLATLYKEHQEGDAQFCFAEFIDSNEPHIHMTDSWNVCIAPDKVVANDLIFGDQLPTHAIVTGPNAGGKSTILKGAFIGALLAQSIGIVPASRCVMTPFSFLATYMNITDDITAGKSLFKAEVLRTHDLLTQIQQMPHNQFSFIIMDEMFSGTNPKEGQAAAFSVAKHLGECSNNICLIATHYDLLTTLQNYGTYMNAHVSVDQSTRGLHYPFQLKPGVSNQHVALDILEHDGFASDIIDTARTIINDL